MHATAIGEESPRPRPWLPARGPHLQSTRTVDGLVTRSKSLAGTVKIHTVYSPAIGGENLRSRDPGPSLLSAQTADAPVTGSEGLDPLALEPSLSSTQTVDASITDGGSLRPRELGPSLLRSQTVDAPVTGRENLRPQPLLTHRERRAGKMVTRKFDRLGYNHDSGKSNKDASFVRGASLPRSRSVDAPATRDESLVDIIRLAISPATQKKSHSDTAKHEEAPAALEESLADSVNIEEKSLVHLKRCRRWEVLLERFNRVAHLPLTAKGLTAALEACYYLSKGPEALSIIDTLRSRSPNKATQAW